MIRHALDQIEDWPERAKDAGYCVKTLAEQCHVSVRTLERFFAERFGLSPYDWLHEERMKQACERLLDGSSVKETAAILRYNSQQHFSQDFKHYHGCPPSRLRHPPPHQGQRR